MNELPEGAMGWLKDAKNLVANFYHRTRGEGFAGRDLIVMRRLQRAGRVKFGRGSYGVPTIHAYIYATTCLYVGNYSSIASHILLGAGHANDSVTTYPHRILWRMEGAGTDGFPAPSKDTIIGSDVWTGWGSVILSGITIGDGAIVGAGAVVTKDVEPYAIVGGNPAKLIRYRFPEEQRNALLDIRWWEWPDDEIRAAVPLLAGKDVDAFIDYAAQRFPSREPVR
jgi:acetyltransferase-like isoleucine patch superfamily enzyme